MGLKRRVSMRFLPLRDGGTARLARSLSLELTVKLKAVCFEQIVTVASTETGVHNVRFR